MKPRIHRSQGQWRCFSRGIFGIRISGVGETPYAAFADWYFNGYHEEYK